MKGKHLRISAVFMMLILSVSLSACSGAPKTQSSTTEGAAAEADTEAEETEAAAKEEEHKLVTIKESPDKYTWYMQDYVGKNLANVGYTSLGGERLEAYGAGYIRLGIITDDGTAIDISDEDQLKDYVVAAQSYEPNTEIKYTFECDSDGEEYDNLVAWQNISEIDLLVKKVGSDLSADAPELVSIQPSTDKYTYFVPDFVGKNLSLVGYTSLGGDRMCHIGESYIQLNIMTDDGSYIEVYSDDENVNVDDILKEYVVVEQNVDANTEIKMAFEKDSDGEEYDNLVSWKSIEQIDILVKKVGSDLSADAPELVSVNPSPDRYTFYIRNYVGKNLASAGYTSLGGKRMDAYGSCYLELVLQTADGSYVDIEDDEALKSYVITDQDIEANSELTVTYCKDSDGNEYENLIDTQSYSKITLLLEKLE